jgi:hypothetical protein
MCIRDHEGDDMEPERLFTADEVAELLGVSARKVLMLPIRQIRMGSRTIRYRLSEVYSYLDIDNPNI